MLSGDLGIHTKRIEIFENERYSPLSGWSSKALLLTDRKVLSNHDGSEGYNTMEEANQVLLSVGWQWDETPWMIDKGSPAHSQTDEDGWTYSSDFTSFSSENQASTNISGTKGIMHFVRRRRLIRNQYFDVNLICRVVNFTCDHCDLKEAEKLATLFLEKYTQASLRRYPRNITASKALSLKNALIVALQVADHDLMENTEDSSQKPAAPTRSNSLSFFSRSKSISISPAAPTVTEKPAESTEKAEKADDATPSTEDNKEVDRTRTSSIDQESPPAQGITASSTLNTATLTALLAKYPLTTYSYERVQELLESFVQSSATTLSLASSLVGNKNIKSHEYLESRQHELNRSYFSKEERIELARLLLRKYDTSHEYHCEVKNCGFSCQFRIEQCSNANCFVQFSHKWWSEHDAICPEKLLHCERVCGEEVLRKNMSYHLDHTCELRPVVCPYHCVGCKQEGLVARTLTAHIETSVHPHMNQLMERLLEQQQVITSMYGKVHELEEVNKNHWKEIVAVQSSIAAATIALKASESRHEKHLQDSIKQLDQKINRVDSNMRHELQKEIGKLGIRK